MVSPQTFADDLQFLIDKHARTLTLLDGGRTIKTYRIALGRVPCGDKKVEGDGRTPEGDLFVFTKNDKSKYCVSLGLSYPGRKDAERGLVQKLITEEQYDEIVAAVNEKRKPLQHTPLGGEIYIHGGGAVTDWTDGCVALANEDMRELFSIAFVGMSVTIRP